MVKVYALQSHRNALSKLPWRLWAGCLISPILSSFICRLVVTGVLQLNVMWVNLPAISLVKLIVNNKCSLNAGITGRSILSSCLGCKASTWVRSIEKGNPCNSNMSQPTSPGDQKKAWGTVTLSNEVQLAPLAVHTSWEQSESSHDTKTCVGRWKDWTCQHLPPRNKTESLARDWLANERQSWGSAQAVWLQSLFLTGHRLLSKEEEQQPKTKTQGAGQRKVRNTLRMTQKKREMVQKIS